MVNTFKDLEEGAIQALQDLGSPPIYPVGPLVQMDHLSTAADGLDCLRWLDDQPRGSVLFVSFGSGGTLSSNQITELALGLEMSEQRFLWVVRSPDDEIANASFFSIQTKKDPVDFLPQGFIERTKGQGLVVPNWAPQAQILSHGSTGGFMTHCGWNSILETVVNGVPVIAWPLYAEQKMNSAMLTEGLKVALRPQVSEKGLVGRVEIATLVKHLMEGEEGKRLRTRMRDLKDAASKVLSDEGSSTKAIAQVASKWSS
ncbi:UDPGT domain-containing protein [Heracleum sosnowskyi]|uniref:UDPGT domain-containing protein n=1 Tax=Heracleum sosnowskyi TaxID=360622 RepID=A0AAD8I1Y4_9APIA|nr:UDPGT domain-containing protein [Heracleum sosnowskyi]